MRKRTMGCLAAPLTLLLGYGLWVSHPPLRHEREIQRILTAVTYRRESRGSLARNGKLNGYLHAGWQTVWGRKTDVDPRSSRSKALRAWLDWCSLARGEDVDYVATDTRRDAAFQRALKGWQAVVPELLALLSKPQFILPADASPEEMIPGYTGCRLIATAMHGYAMFLHAQGQTQRSVESLVPVLRWSRKLMAEERLSSFSAGLQVQEIAAAGVADVLGPEQRPDVALLRRLTRELEMQLPPLDLWQAGLESELAAAEQTFDKLPRSRPDLPHNIILLLRFPGIKERERRLYRDEMFPYLEHALEDSNTLRQGRGTEHEMLQSWLRGRRGVLAVMLLPELNEVKADLLGARCRIAAIHALAGIRLYEQLEGSLPRHLSALTKIGVAELPAFAWHDARRFIYERRGSGFRLTVMVPGEAVRDSTRDPGPSRLLRRTSEGFVADYRSR